MAVAQQAMDFLFDGLMIEVHCAPPASLSDAKQQVTPRQYGRLINQLNYVSSDGPARLPEEMKLLRKEIDGIDTDLITLLAKRMECVRHIGTLKRVHNVSLFQPERWEHVIQDRVRSSARNHLSESFARDLFEHIHEEALLIQGRIPTAKSSASRRRKSDRVFAPATGI